MDELKPKREKPMPDETDKLKAEQEKNWEMLRKYPANQELSKSPMAALGALDTYKSSSKNTLSEEDEKGHPHSEASERP